QTDKPNSIRFYRLILGVIGGGYFDGCLGYSGYFLWLFGKACRLLTGVIFKGKNKRHNSYGTGEGGE
ncbi:MAG: hypothetical protein ABW185_10740, partial [Sedimenticola sp.]